MFEIPANYRTVNISKFSIKLIEKINQGSFHFLFLGPVGCGKTTIAKLIFKYMDNIRFEKIKGSKNGIQFPIWLEAWEVYREYLGMVIDNRNYVDAFDDRMKVHFLIFDDIGAEHPSTEKAHDFIASLIEIRYRQLINNPDFRNNSCTVLISNLPMDGTEKSFRSFYGDRIVDRLIEMCIIVKFGDHCFRAEKREVWV